MVTKKINCQFDLINYTYTFKMYNGHCINPYPSFFSLFFFKDKVCVQSIYTCTIIRQHFTKQGMNNNTDVSNQTFLPTLFLRGDLRSCPMILIHFPVPPLMGVQGNVRN